MAHWQAFEVQRQILIDNAVAALVRFCTQFHSDHLCQSSNAGGQHTFDAAPQIEEAHARALSLPAIAGGLTLVSRLSGFLQSNYTFANIELTPDQAMLAAQTAENLRCAGATVSVPVSWTNPQSVTAFINEFKGLDTALSVIAYALRVAQSAKDHAPKADGHPATTYDDTIGALTSFVDAYQAFGKSLFDGTPTTTPAVGVVLQEHALQQVMQTYAILWLKVNSVGGTTYVKRNFWTFLVSGAPLYVSGAATVTFEYFGHQDPAASEQSLGTLTAAGVLSNAQRFRQIEDVHNVQTSPRLAGEGSHTSESGSPSCH